MSAINFNEVPSSKTNEQALNEADSQLGCWSSLWNVKNRIFVKTFHLQTIGVTGAVDNHGFLH